MTEWKLLLLKREELDKRNASQLEILRLLLQYHMSVGNI